MSHSAKVYNLPYGHSKRWRRLYFLDECPFCGKTVASLQECDNEGMIRIISRKVGKEAIKLRDRVTKISQLKFKTQSGTFEKERVLFNNRGIIFNFNNRKVGTNEEFLTKTFA